MPELNKSDEPIWEQGWEGHREAQLMRWASLSFKDKLMWLEEAQQQLEQMRRLRKDPKKNNTES